MLKTSVDQVVFTRFIDISGDVHFAADWDDQAAKYTKDLNKQVRKILKAQAKAEFGYWSAITGSSVVVQQPA